MNTLVKIEQLDLGHREIIEKSIASLHTDISEYSFANLFLFRKQHQYKLLMDERPAIIGKAYDGESYAMPLFEINRENLPFLERLISEYEVLFPLEEDKLSLFPAERYQYYYCEDDSDYIYTREKMSHYPGRKLHKKRNLLKQFKELYESHEIWFNSIDDIEESHAMEILDSWQRDVASSKEETDYFQCREALRLLDNLNLEGFIYYVDNEPAGFLIGEALNRKTHAIHFAKGRRKFKGLYQYMYSHFAKNLPEGVEYINFEQDLGKLALKIAKSSYQPDIMLHKYRLRLRETLR